MSKGVQRRLFKEVNEDRAEGFEKDQRSRWISIVGEKDSAKQLWRRLVVEE